MNGFTLPPAVQGALPADFARELVETIGKIPAGVAQVSIFCPERQCVVVGLASRDTLESWVITAAVDVADAAAIGRSLMPMFAQVADTLGHFAAADAIAKARSH